MFIYKICKVLGKQYDILNDRPTQSLSEKLTGQNENIRTFKTKNMKCHSEIQQKISFTSRKSC